MEHQFKVKKSERGRRLDVFLHEKMETWSHRQIKNAIDHKRVFVNGKNVFISGWNLKPNDQILFKPLKADQPTTPTLNRYHFVKVLYEDDALLVVDKPPFVDYDTFVLYVNNYLKRANEFKPNFHPYVGQMHRLDKETSGVLIFTKKKSANILANQFRDHKIVKYYIALVLGSPPKEHLVVRDAIEKGFFEGGKKARITDDEDQGKASLSEFWIKERYSHASLVRVQIKTGRTHQIRIHSSNKGFPVLGDKLYGNPEAEKKLFTTGKNPIKRHMLHAERIEFRHPLSGDKIKVEAPIPEDIEKVIDRLRMQE